MLVRDGMESKKVAVAIGVGTLWVPRTQFLVAVAVSSVAWSRHTAFARVEGMLMI